MDWADLTQNSLKGLLHYNPSTGAWTWLLREDDDRWNRRYAGTRAGTIGGYGYRLIMLRPRQYRSGRLAVLYVTGEWPIGFVDHKNRDRADDRWNNLRVGSNSQNSANMGINSTNKSGLKGVHYHTRTGKWVAQIRIPHQGKKFLGYFDDKFKAAEVYRIHALQLHGQFARFI